MFCKKCGAQIDDNSSFCSVCGSPQQPKTNPAGEMRYNSNVSSVPQQKNEQSKMTEKRYSDIYPMKWYKCVIYVQLFLNALISISNAVSYLFGLPYGEYAETVYVVYKGLKVLDIGMAAASIAQAVFALVVRQALAKFRKKGPNLYLLLLSVNIVLTVMYSVIASIILDMDFHTFVSDAGLRNLGANLGAIIFLIVLNRIYFDKRKELFVN